MISSKLPLFGMLILAATMFAGCRGPAGGGGSAAATPAPGGTDAQRPNELMPVRFQATVYELQAPTERLGTLDGNALAAKAATVESLSKALAAIGTPRVLYRIDQPANLFSEQIRIITREPVVTGTRKNSAGDEINTVQYQDLGVIVRLSAQAASKEAKRKNPDVKMSVELAALAPSDTQVPPGRKTMVTRTLSLDHSEPLKFGRPLVMLAISSAAADARTPATAYVVRYLFSPPIGR